MKKIKIPGKSSGSGIDRVPSLAELQRILTGAKSSRMRLALMFVALCGL
ncbi:MAG: hypothetical protein QXP57_07110 [Nitrososphaerota archaeon]